MGERQQYGPEGWLDLATADIRFKPDRAAVRAELKAHIEDQAEAIRRRHPDLSEEEAERQATAQMGDPEEWAGRWPGSTGPGWGTCGGSVR